MSSNFVLPVVILHRRFDNRFDNGIIERSILHELIEHLHLSFWRFVSQLSQLIEEDLLILFNKVLSIFHFFIDKSKSILNLLYVLRILKDLTFYFKRVEIKDVDHILGVLLYLLITFYVSSQYVRK